MTSNNDAATLVRLAITPGAESPQQAADRLGDQRAFAVMSAALAIAASRRFPDGTAVSDIEAFVAGLPNRFPDAGDVLKPTVAEAVIRAARGEADRLAGLNHGDVAPLLFLLTYAIMTETQLSDADQAEYVQRVLTMAGE